MRYSAGYVNILLEKSIIIKIKAHSYEGKVKEIAFFRISHPKNYGQVYIYIYMNGNGLTAAG
jgi:hypothetical protein